MEQKAAQALKSGASGGETGGEGTGSVRAIFYLPPIVAAVIMAARRALDGVYAAGFWTAVGAFFVLVAALEWLLAARART